MKKGMMFLLIVFMLILASCVPGRGKYAVENAGFWTGIWHGAISPVTMVIGIFDKETRIYEIDNRGRSYDIGFIIGILLIWGGSSTSCCYRKRK